MIKRLLQTAIVLLPSITVYISKIIGLHELFTLILAIAIYYILYNSKLFRYYQDTVTKLHPQYPDTRIVSIVDLVEYLCIKTSVIPAVVIMVIMIYKMTVLLFEHLIITGESFPLEVQVLTEGDALLYVALSIIAWISSMMLYPTFRGIPSQVSKYLYENHNILIEDENKGE